MWTAALRVASLAAPHGLERVLSAAALGVAAAVVEALALGLVGLGASSIALAAAAALTLLAAQLAPAPELPARTELARWWAHLPLRGRLITGALVGTWLACQAWLLRYPSLGLDSITYHVSEAMIWAGNGHPGGTDLVYRALPVTNYPVTAEVFLTWGLGLSRSFVPVALLVPSQVALLGLAAWSGLRALSVPRLPRALGTAAACVMPAVIGWQSNGALTDPAALAWLVACAALCAASPSRPVLLAPALVAGGLALGIKTTTGPLLVLVLVMAGWVHRERLRGLWKPLAAAALLAFLCGGVWYARNLIEHGSPLWPFLAAPWGTSVPRAIALVDYSFTESPIDTVRFAGDLYVERFLGGLVLLAGALAAPVLAPRRRAVWVASGAAGLSVLIWAQAPFSGVPPSLRIPETVFTTTRYLAPAVMAAILALALAGSGGGRRARVAQLILAVGLVIELVQSFQLGFPAMPSPLTPLAGAVAGAAAIGAGAVISRRVDTPAWRAAPAALVAAVLVAGALLAIPASGYVARHAAAGSSAAGLVDWMARRPADSAGVVGAPGVIGPLAGDRLRRRLEAIPPGTGCRTLRALRRTRYVVLSPGGGADADVRSLVRCLSRPDYRDAVFEAWAPG